MNFLKIKFVPSANDSETVAMQHAIQVDIPKQETEYNFFMRTQLSTTNWTTKLKFDTRFDCLKSRQATVTSKRLAFR